MNKPKLLIVDDDEAIRTQLKYALRDDFTLLFAEDRGGALITLRREPAHVPRVGARVSSERARIPPILLTRRRLSQILGRMLLVDHFALAWADCSRQ